MDHRDVPIWMECAQRELAVRQRRAIEAASFPYMAEADREAVMARYSEQRADQEAAWKRNRAALARLLGRKKS